MTSGRQCIGICPHHAPPLGEGAGAPQPPIACVLVKPILAACQEFAQQYEIQAEITAKATYLHEKVTGWDIKMKGKQDAAVVTGGLGEVARICVDILLSRNTRFADLDVLLQASRVPTPRQLRNSLLLLAEAAPPGKEKQRRTVSAEGGNPCPRSAQPADRGKACECSQ